MSLVCGLRLTRVVHRNRFRARKTSNWLSLWRIKYVMFAIATSLAIWYELLPRTGFDRFHIAQYCKDVIRDIFYNVINQSFYVTKVCSDNKASEYFNKKCYKNIRHPVRSYWLVLIIIVELTKQYYYMNVFDMEKCRYMQNVVVLVQEYKPQQ